MPALTIGLRTSLKIATLILTIAGLQIPASIAAQVSQPPLEASASVSVNLLINYGNGTLEWHNEATVPDNFNAYNLTLAATSGDIEAVYFSSFGSHFVYLIKGVGCPGIFTCETAWGLWILNGVCWELAPVGPDQMMVSDGRTFAWFLVPLATFGQNPPTGANCVTVDIDVKPGSDRNILNLKSAGRVPVAILTTGTFDATSVDPSTVKFGRTGTEAHALSSSTEDVDIDGDLDMVLQFKLQETGILQGDTQTMLMGRTFGGTPFKGSDSIHTSFPGGGSFARSV